MPLTVGFGLRLELEGTAEEGLEAGFEAEVACAVAAQQPDQRLRDYPSADWSEGNQEKEDENG